MTVKCCFLCGEVTTKDLEEHYKAEHMTQEQRDRSFECACGKQFTTAKTRNRHHEKCLG